MSLMLNLREQVILDIGFQASVLTTDNKLALLPPMHFRL